MILEPHVVVLSWKCIGFCEELKHHLCDLTASQLSPVSVMVGCPSHCICVVKNQDSPPCTTKATR